MTTIGRYGVWTGGRQWPRDAAEVDRAAKEVEALGFSTVWIGGARGDLVLPEQILAATSGLTAATGVVNVWQSEAAAVAAAHARVTRAHPERFLLGIGVGHAPFDKAYTKPMEKLTSYLDELDAAAPPVPRDERIVASLGPRSLRIAAERTLGSHPYLVPPEHTADARVALGPDGVLAPEQKVFLGTDPAEARRVARQAVAIYLRLPNYLTNLRRYGLTDDDFTGDGSDRFVDTVVAWGDEAAVRRRIDAHLDAGADHVAVQVLTAADGTGLPYAEWKAVAALLT